MTEIDRFVSLLANNGKDNIAVSFLGQVLDMMPDKLELHMMLTQIYTIGGRREQAINHLDMLANKLVDEDKNQEAIQVVEAIIKLNPSNLAEYQRALIQLRSR